MSKSALSPKPPCGDQRVRALQVPVLAQSLRLAISFHHAKDVDRGRRGNLYDNAKAESFMKTLKVEAVYLMGRDFRGRYG